MAVGCVLAVPARAQRGDVRVDAIASVVEAKMREFHVPGVAVGILDGGVATTRAFGVTSVENPVPVTAHTVFPIASISKTFAATAMMRLVEQGKVDLKAPVRKYLPDFRVRDEGVSRDVTVWHLLTHTSGWEGQIAPTEHGDETLKDFVAGMTDLMQIAPPGAAWSYNNAGFSVAGRVIEAVTGMSINRAIRELVFTPLGLPHAGTTAGEFITHPFALGHSVRGDGPATLQRPFSPSASASMLRPSSERAVRGSNTTGTFCVSTFTAPSRRTRRSRGRSRRTTTAREMNRAEGQASAGPRPTSDERGGR
jgi:CubicO group peptidase (beta-lactamase class C family)